MRNIKIEDKVFESYISQEQIENAVEYCFYSIYTSFWNLEDIVFIGVLNGAAPFFTKLTERLNTFGVTDTDYLKVTSYGDEMYSSGIVKWDLKPSIDFKDKVVVIVDDILDTGKTIDYLKKYFLDNGAKSVHSCVLLWKEKENQKAPDFYGMKIKDYFVIGFGLDYKQKHRNMPEIMKLKDNKTEDKNE